MGGAFIGAGKAAFHLRDALRKNDIVELDKNVELDVSDGVYDNSALDWRWLVLRCERRFLSQTKRRKTTKQLIEALGDNFDINEFSCFVPRTVLEAIVDKRIHYMNDFDVIIERFYAAVVFCDASGFTSLCEALDKEVNGAEKLGESLNNFFSPLIRIVDFWGGDIIKFSGDAVTIVWPVDDELAQEPYDPDNTLKTTCSVDKIRACQLACQCCMDLHKNLNYFPTPICGKYFTLHITVAFGEVTILQVGGISQRWEYVVAGPPMKEIAIGEPLAESGETVISPSVIQVLSHEKKIHFQFLDKELNSNYAKLTFCHEELIKPPPQLEKIKLDGSDAELLKRLAAGYDAFLNEIRRISVVFIGINGLDVSTNQGSQLAQKLMQLTQKAAYTMEGVINKFLVDDKGVLVLVMFGLPPIFHLDDPVRAVLAALRISDGLKTLGLRAKFGVATGRVWCGTIGCEIRKEYTALGDTVNLAARLMSSSDNNQIFCDRETKTSSEHVLEFKSLSSLQVKGKFEKVHVFKPTGRMRSQEQDFNLKNPIESWTSWKPKETVQQMFDTRHRCPLLNVEFPPVDYQVPNGPLMPWEYIDPYMPSLKSWTDIGGVCVIVGQESEDIQELLNYIAKLSKLLNRSIFFSSSMPDEKNLNIANVPLLAWRNVCSEMIFKWKNSPARELKGFSKLGKDNSIYGLSKELLHPSFHWRLFEMKTVVSDLELPQKYIENFKLPASNFLNYQIIKNSIKADSDLLSKLNDIEINPFSPLKNQFDSDRSLAPLISSLVNGYAMYEPTILCLHVRTGTSLFNTMDSESWKTAKLVGRIAMTRRYQKLKSEIAALKNWRRKHSRQCLWCQNTSFVDLLNTQTISNEWASRCRPPRSKYFPPFLYIVACSEISKNNLDQQELIQWAKECNSFIQMERLNYIQVRNYIAHCLSLNLASVPLKLLHCIYKISGGISKYIFLTIKYFVAKRIILIIDTYCSRRDDELSTWNLVQGNNLRPSNSKLLSQPQFLPLSTSRQKKTDKSLQFQRNFDISGQKYLTNDILTIYNFEIDGQCDNIKLPNFKQVNIKTQNINIGDKNNSCLNLEKFGHVYGKLQETSKSLYPVQSLTNFQLNAIKNKLVSTKSLQTNKLKSEKNGRLQNFSFENDVEAYCEKKPRNQQVVVLQNLSSVPCIPELEAATISLLERLDPDEQVLAKLASFFPSTFTAFELQIAHPKKLKYLRFESILLQLVEKEMFEKLCVSPNKQNLSKSDIRKLQTGLSQIDYLTANNNFYIHYLGHFTKIPIHVYRFTSSVYQKVIRNLLVSQKRKELETIVNNIISRRLKKQPYLL